MVLTEEDCKRLLDEGVALRKSLEPMLNAMHNITAEDLTARVK